jgi:hypothetical protein
MHWFINAQGQLYQGDMAPYDRLATDAEVAAAAVPTMAVLTAAIQTAIDEKAQQYGYDDIDSTSKYGSITDAAIAAMPADIAATATHFRAESQALSAWAAQTWAMAYALQAQVKAGNAVMPTIAQALADMPAYTEPTP